MVNFSQKEKNFIYFQLERTNKIEEIFRYGNNLFAVIFAQNEYFLVGNNSKIKLQGNISKIFYVKDEECLIILRNKEIVIYSLKLQSEINVMNFEWNEKLKQDIKMGQINESEFYVLIQYKESLQYCYFDFYELNQIIKKFESEIFDVDFSDSFCLIQLQNQVIVYDIFLEDQIMIANIRQKSQYLILEQNLLCIQKQNSIQVIDLENKKRQKFSIKNFEFIQQLKIIHKSQNKKFLQYNDQVITIESQNSQIIWSKINLDSKQSNRRIIKTFLIDEDNFMFIIGQKFVCYSLDNQLQIQYQKLIELIQKNSQPKNELKKFQNNKSDLVKNQNKSSSSKNNSNNLSLAQRKTFDKEKLITLIR